MKQPNVWIRLQRWWVLRLTPGGDSRALWHDLAEGYGRLKRKRGALPALAWLGRECLAACFFGVRDRLRDRSRLGPYSVGTSGAGLDLGAWGKNFGPDLRVAARIAFKRRAFALLTILMIALGIGLNGTLLSVVKGTLFQTFAYPESGQLRILMAHRKPTGSTRNALSIPEMQDYARGSHEIGEMGIASRSVRMGLMGGGVARPVKALFVNSAYLRIAAVPPLLGRLFDSSEDVGPGGHPVAVLGHAFWRTRFGSDPGLIGRSINLSGREYQVVGVLRPEFHAPRNDQGAVEVFLPLTMGRPFLGQAMFQTRHARQYSGLIRVDSPLQEERIKSDFRHTAVALAQDHPLSQEGWGVAMFDLRSYYYGPMTGSLAALVAGAVLVLVLCCVNVAAMLLTHGKSRHREISVRMALGAGRVRIVRQLLTESSLLIVVGGSAGLVLAYLATGYVQALDLGFPSVADIRLDAELTAGLAALILMTGVFSGIVPALRSSGAITSRDALAARSSAGAQGSGGYGSFIVAAEVALATVLVVGAGLAVKSMADLLALPLGYDTGSLTTFTIDLNRPAQPGAANSEDAQRRRARFARRFVEEAGALAGVEAAALVGPDRLGRAHWGLWIARDDADPSVRDNRTASLRVLMTPGGLQAIGTGLKRGRDFHWSDDLDSPAVGIINESFARALWPGLDPLGKRFHDISSSGTFMTTVVGVAEEVRHNGRMLPQGPTLYTPYSQRPRNFVSAALRSSDRGIARSAEEVVHAIDPSAVVYGAARVDDLIRRQERIPRYTVALMSLYALLTGLLSTLGIYGVFSYRIRLQSRELAVRRALGSTSSGVMKLVLSRSLFHSGKGLLAGVAAAFAATRLTQGLVFGLASFDAKVAAIAVSLLLAAATAASLFPALRAARSDPMSVLRRD